LNRGCRTLYGLQTAATAAGRRRRERRAEGRPPSMPWARSQPRRSRSRSDTARERTWRGRVAEDGQCRDATRRGPPSCRLGTCGLSGTGHAPDPRITQFRATIG
jgi:hypothetical protein